MNKSSCSRYKKSNTMGLFSFIKNAGAALAGNAKKAPDTSAKDANTRSNAMDELADTQLAMRITNHISSMGLKVKDLKVDVDDDKATVYGAVESQDEREKVVLAAGNVAGIATVDDRISVVVPEAVFYTVQKGDTLSKIAKAQYGSAGKYMVIFEANKPMLEDPDKIYPGQVLRIPRVN